MPPPYDNSGQTEEWENHAGNLPKENPAVQQGETEVGQLHGIAAKLAEFTKLKPGGMKCFETRTLDSELNPVVTARMYVFRKEKDEFTVMRFIPDHPTMTVFDVNASGVVTSMDDNVDVSNGPFGSGVIDATIPFNIVSAAPLNMEAYAQSEAERIVNTELVRLSEAEPRLGFKERDDDSPLGRG